MSTPSRTPKTPQWDELPRLSRYFASRAAHYDETGSFAFENHALLHQHGFLALTLPTDYGGAGGGLSEVCRVLDWVARGDAPTALVLSMYYMQHHRQARERTWPEATYREVVATSLREPGLINSLANEPELGSGARGGTFGTTATKVDGGWRLSGHKRYSTGSVGLRWFMVAASKAGEEKRGYYWLVPQGAPGLRIVETWDQLGMRGTASHDVILEDVFVPDSALLGERLVGRDGPASGWSAAAWNSVYLGVAKAALDVLVDFAEARVPTSLGHPISQLPAIRQKVGQIELLIASADRLTRSLAHDLDHAPQTVSFQDAGAVKQYGRDHAIQALQLAVGAVGNAGLARGFPLERLFRDVQFGPHHPPFGDVIERGAADAAFARRAQERAAASVSETTTTQQEEKVAA